LDPGGISSRPIEVKVEDADDLERVITVVERSRASSEGIWRDIYSLEQSQVWREESFGVQVPFAFPENEATMLRLYLDLFGTLFTHRSLQLFSNSKFKELLATNRRHHQAPIRLLAIISCGLGVNAYGWSRNKLRPVIVTFEGNEILGLVPNTVFEESSHPEFFVVEAKSVVRPLRRWRKFALFANIYIFQLPLLVKQVPSFFPDLAKIPG
jgi:hypothetical protein